MLQEFAAKKLRIELPDYAATFIRDDPFSLPQDIFVCSTADAAAVGLLEKLFEKATACTSSETILKPTSATTESVRKAFEGGAPYDGDASLGDLINAAWEVFQNGEPKGYAKQGRELAEYLSDLVLKSAEIAEIRKILK